MQQSLGLIEVSGMSLAITVADVMAKTAAIGLIGMERTIGSGWMLVKISGDVSSVRTALAAAEMTAKQRRGFIASATIARPAPGTDGLVAPKPPAITAMPEPEPAPEREEITSDEATICAISAQVPPEPIVPASPTAPLRSDDARKPTCKLCGDPLCRRIKGEPRRKCIHHQKSVSR